MKLVNNCKAVYSVQRNDGTNSINRLLRMVRYYIHMLVYICVYTTRIRFSINTLPN